MVEKQLVLIKRQQALKTIIEEMLKKQHSMYFGDPARWRRTLRILCERKNAVSDFLSFQKATSTQERNRLLEKRISILESKIIKLRKLKTKLAERQQEIDNLKRKYTH